MTNEIVRFEEAKQQIATMAAKCKNIVVNSRESLDFAKTLAKDASKIEKFIEDRRKDLTKPLVDQKREIDDFSKNLTKELNEAIKTVREQIKNFELELERQRQEELRKLEEQKKQIEEAQKKQAEEAQKTDGVHSPLPSIDMLCIRMREKELEQDRSKSLRKIWKFEITDAILIPREYLVPDERKISAAVAAGIREIPGVHIYQEEQLVLR